MTKTKIKPTPAAVAAAELIINTWREDGVCADPETIKFPLGNDLTAAILLGSTEAGEWRFGYDVQAKSGDLIWGCTLTNIAYPDRMAAFAAAIADVMHALRAEKDTGAARKVESFAKGFSGTAVAAAVETPADAVRVGLGMLPKGRFAEIPLEAIHANPDNPRKFFDAVAMRELADSIQAQGLLQPVAVRRMLPEELGEDPTIAAAAPAERFELILGERRWRAAQMPHRDEMGLIVPGSFTLGVLEAKVYEGVTRAQAKAAALVENLQREKMNAIEEAEGFRDLIASQTPPLTQEQAAAIVGKSRPVVANALRVLELPLAVVESIRDGKLTLAHGVALARFKDFPKAVELMAHLAIAQGSKAAQLEKGVPFGYELEKDGLAVSFRNWSDPKPAPALVKKHPAYFADGEGGVVCFDLKHWGAEVERLAAEKKEEAERAAAKAAAALKRATAKGAPMKSLGDLNEDNFRELKGSAAGLLELIPEEKRTIAQGYNGEKVEITTDTALAERLTAALSREVKKDRRARLEGLAADVRSYLGKLKKIGPRETALIYAEMVTYPGHQLYKQFDAAACKATGITQPAAFRVDSSRDDDEGEPEEGKARMPQIMRELRALERLDAVACFRVIAEERLAAALDEIVEHGPTTPSAYLLRWMLDREELGLLEESDEGKATLIERVKAAKWYQSEVVGAPISEEEAAAAKQIERFKQLAGEGMTLADIAIQLGVSHPAAHNLRKQILAAGDKEAAA